MSRDRLDAQVAGLIEDATVDGASRELFTRIRVVEAGTEISDDRTREYMTVLQRLGLDGG